jgi:hypothetical protein
MSTMRTPLNQSIHGIAAYEVIENFDDGGGSGDGDGGGGGSGGGGILIDCYNADGAYLGRRYFPEVSDPAGIPGALAGGAVESRPPTPVTAKMLRARLLARLAERRWEVESGGFVFLDRVIASDDRSQLAILGVFTAARADPNFTTIWKCADASWLTLSNAQCLALFEVAARHKQECFARETVLAGQIEAIGADRAALRDFAAVVEAFWP